MPLISDITDLVAKITVDFSSGAYGSLSKDIGDGFNKLGDLLQTFVGFRSSDPTEVTKLQEAVEAAKDCKPHASFAANAASVGAIDPMKLFAAFQTLVEALTKIWSTFHPAAPTNAD